MKPTLVFDIETYRDYFLVSFLNIDTGNVRTFEAFDGQELDRDTLRAIVRKYRQVSFNGINFDLPLLTMAMGGASVEAIKSVADKIIKNNMRYWQLGIEPVQADHIDLIEVAPGIASLKMYAGRLHAPKMQDLPIDPDASINSNDPIEVDGCTLTEPADKRAALRRYCVNDLHNTKLLFETFAAQIELREQMGEQYGVDLRSKSDAQIAEAVIVHEVEKITGRRIEKQDPFRLAGQTFKYRLPGFIKAASALQQTIAVVTAVDFTVAGNGTVQMPKEIANLKICIGNSTYKMGIGGLHSMEKSVTHRSDDEFVIIDRDVASYYPNIILNCGLKPANMGEHFTKVYRSIVQRRLAAKARGDKITAETLKIVVNGSFGKFGSPYSRLYSPTLLIQTTVTGQLALLMLIEILEAEGIAVVSANTDGIVMKCPRGKQILCELIVWEWEAVTGFTTEETRYTVLASRDVNSYVAVKADGYKVKGAFAPPKPVGSSWPNPTTQVCADAVVAYLRHGKPIEETIRECRDVRQFVSIRTVKGGAIDQSGAYLGKAVRWYYACGVTGPLRYKLNGYTVAKTEGARPLMQLPDTLPDDLDLDWYIREAQTMLADVGAA